MYCPKCGAENPDAAQLCHSCSWVLTSSSTSHPGPYVKTSRLAIASLVLGISGFILCIPGFLAAVLGLILGIAALSKIKRSNGVLSGKGLAIAGISTSAVSLFFSVAITLAAILMPALARVRAVSYRMVCATNMTALGKTMLIYASGNDDMYPTTSKWCDLLIERTDVSPLQFRCRGAFGCRGGLCYKRPSGKVCTYMNKNIEELGITAPPDIVLLFETRPGWNQAGGPEILTADNHYGQGCNVLFNDGHVEFVKTEDINDLKWTAE